MASALIRDERGAFVSSGPALDRFLSFCRFDATTGCVLWTGGTSSGRGKSARYGAFKYEGRRWPAHRWAAQFIHGLAIDGYHVDHCCPAMRAGDEPLPPNTLCVRHLQALTLAENVALRDERRNWLLTQKGYLQAPPLFAEMAAPGAPPFHLPPAWLRVDNAVNLADDDCPF